MSRPKTKSKTKEGGIDPGANTTLQTKVGIKQVLLNEKTRRYNAGVSVSMGQIMAEALASFISTPECRSILEEAGYKLD